MNTSRNIGAEKEKAGSEGRAKVISQAEKSYERMGEEITTKTRYATMMDMRERGDNQGWYDNCGLKTNEFGFAFLELLHSTVELSSDTFFCSSLLVQSVFERLFLLHHRTSDKCNLAFRFF